MTALGLYVKQIAIIYVGYGVIGGVGLGISYISPVSPTTEMVPTSSRRGCWIGHLRLWSWINLFTLHSESINRSQFSQDGRSPCGHRADLHHPGFLLFPHHDVVRPGSPHASTMQVIVLLVSPLIRPRGLNRKCRAQPEDRGFVACSNSEQP
ncbi:hypothetical protein RvY_11028 [Ramazzottius varieornatus]|uniref:Uncharacterized protein n=1 Tax=Ramazzottius varieornatus TaxID=947166 RepID=A0A1D1VER5_RAMVA|nr:hypothetical protein RvY_11028 [Ramazzottius varieornatus]